MSQKTVQLYDELERFIKKHTDTYGEEERLIVKLNEYARELRREGGEQSEANNLNAVIAAAHKARARGFEEGKNQGYIEGYSMVRQDGGILKAYENGLEDGKKQAQDFINREKEAKENALKQLKELVASTEREKCADYNRGREEGARLAQFYEQRYLEVQKYKENSTSKSLHDLIEKSIKEHNADDDKVRKDIEEFFNCMFDHAVCPPGGIETKYKPIWLIAQAAAHSIGRIVGQFNTVRHMEYVNEIANEIMSAVAPDKIFVVGRKLTGKSGDSMIFDDVIGEALKTKQWTDVKKSLPAYGEPVRVTFDLKDPEGEEKSEHFSVARLVWHEGAPHWEYESKVGGRYPLTGTSVKGWRYVSEAAKNEWIDIKTSAPMPGHRVEIKLGNGDGWKESVRIAKNVLTGYDYRGGDYFDYSDAEWNHDTVNPFAPNKFYVKNSVVTHWRYTNDSPERAGMGVIEWQRMADNQPPLNVWVEAKTDHPRGEVQKVRRQYSLRSDGLKFEFCFEFQDGPVVGQDLCCLTQWRYI